MKNVTALAVIDSETLMKSEFRERRFCVETLLPQWLCMLAGAPKIGKSWMALDLALHVAKGEALWGLKVHPGTVLYLCLEDGNGRIHDRLNAITDEGAGNLFLSFEADSLNDGLIPQLMNFKKEHPDLALIIYEFIVRQNLRKAFARRADETEYAGAASGRNGTRERADRQPAGNGFADAGYGFGTRQADSADAGDTQRDGNPTPEGLADDRKFAEGNENTAPRQRTTGWESARPDFFADRKIQSLGSHYPMGAQHSVRPAKPAHSGIGDLAGIASAVSILNNGDSEESEEEKREREARENGNAIGAVVGSVIGLLSALDPDCDENSDETESEENTFGLFM